MGKYNSARRPPTPKRPTGVNPVMRGIGCIMIVIVPIFSYGVAVYLVNGPVRAWIPPGLMGTVKIHPLLMKLQGLLPVWDFIQRQNNLAANLVFAVLITLVVGGIMSIIFGYIYTIFGPSKYGPTDVPPIKQKAKPYKR